MFKQDSQSIQQLLVAEKKAEDRVGQARKRKNLLLKQAKIDAKAEIDVLREEKEKEFKVFESKFLGDKENNELKIERSTEQGLKELSISVKLNKESIVNYLLDQVFSINCAVHENFRADVI